MNYTSSFNILVLYNEVYKTPSQVKDLNPSLYILQYKVEKYYEASFRNAKGITSQSNC